MKNEEHEIKAKGWWIPEQVCTAYNQGRIKATAVILLAHIDSLANAQFGCIASNAYLAKKTRLSEFRTRQIIQELIKLGLVIRVSFNGRVRELTTPWTALKLNAEPEESSELNNPPVQNRTGGKCRTAQAETSILRAKTTPLVYNCTSQSTSSNLQSPARAKREGFFSKNGFLKPKQRESLHSIRAKLLHSELAKKRLLPINANYKDWPKYFEMLAAELKDDDHRLDRVLNWYLINVGRKFVPEAFSPRSFRDKFIRIEQAMVRLEPEKTKELVLNPKLDQLIEDLKKYHDWPNKTEKELPYVVNQSYLNYREFYFKHKAWAKTLRKLDEEEQDDGDPDDPASVNHYFVERGLVGNPPKAFLYDWFQQVHEKIDWEGWSGKLKNYIWTPEHSLYLEWGHSLVLEYLSDNDPEGLLQEFLTHFK